MAERVESPEELEKELARLRNPDDEQSRMIAFTGTPFNVGVGVATIISGLLLLGYDCCLISTRWSNYGWALLGVVLVGGLWANM